MTNTRLTAMCLGPLLLLCFSQSSAAIAGECASAPVSARGEPAAFEWLAKTKARANWRSRVRGTRALGEAYSTWNRADAREERCSTTTRGIVCTFTATPCQR